MAQGILHWGTVSHGTLRSQDLLQSFSSVLAEHEPDSPLIKEAETLAEKLNSYQSNMVDWQANAEAEEYASELVNTLQDKLNEIASRFGGYFGTTEGDGSDFGFWQLEEESQP
jgi:hypothetical protein